MLVKKEEQVLPKVSYQVGACLDVPTSTLIQGKRGETIIMGGVGNTMAVVGPGNSFKTKIAHYFALKIIDHLIGYYNVSVSTYDTEVNVVIEQLVESLIKMENLSPDDYYTKEFWEITDKSQISGNEWVKRFIEYTNEKIKDKKNIIKYEALKNPSTGKMLELPTLSMVVVDSLSDFEPESTVEMVEGIGNDNSDVNMLDMRRGRFTNNFLSLLPSRTVKSQTFVFFTAKVGEKKDIATGPAKYAKIPKKLQHMDKNVFIKGVSPEFAYSMFAAYLTETAVILKNPTTKQPEYPIGDDDEVETDLNTVKLRMLRSKRGPSGYSLDLVISQKYGVLPTLTELHYIKQNNRYGLEGNNVHYNVVFYPEVKITRKSARRKIDEDPKLRRAIQIASEMHQLFLFHPILISLGLHCTPKELYEDLKKMGYDWDCILTKRGYMLPNQYSADVDFLSTVDLLRMRKGLYTPYFKKGKK